MIRELQSARLNKKLSLLVQRGSMFLSLLQEHRHQNVMAMARLKSNSLRISLLVLLDKMM